VDTEGQAGRMTDDSLNAKPPEGLMEKLDFLGPDYKVVGELLVKLNDVKSIVRAHQASVIERIKARYRHDDNVCNPVWNLALNAAIRIIREMTESGE
jgi:hypothetical protein